MTEASTYIIGVGQKLERIAILLLGEPFSDEGLSPEEVFEVLVQRGWIEPWPGHEDNYRITVAGADRVLASLGLEP